MLPFQRVSSFLLRPLSVEAACLVGALVGVRSKEVSLRLREVGGQAVAAVGVVVGQRGAEGSDRHSLADGQHDDGSQCGVALVHLGSELRVDEQRSNIGAAVVCALDAVEEPRADDAAALPDARDLAQVQLPVVHLAGGTDQVHALRVRANLGGVQLKGERRTGKKQDA